MTDTTTMDQDALLERLQALRELLWELEMEETRSSVTGAPFHGTARVRLTATRASLKEIAKDLRRTGLGVCRVCYCTDVTACTDDAGEFRCSWLPTMGLGELCSQCLDEDLERRYLMTVWALGLDWSGGPMVASAARAGDVVVRYGKEERIVETTWTQGPTPETSTVQIVTLTRTFELGPEEPLTHRKVPDVFADLLEPAIAELRRRDILLKAEEAGKIVATGREYVVELLGVDLETGEAVDA